MLPPVPGKLLRSGVPQSVKLSTGDCVVEYQAYSYNTKVTVMRNLLCYDAYKTEENSLLTMIRSTFRPPD